MNTEYRTLHVHSGSVSGSRSDFRILASHQVAGVEVLQLCPKGTIEKETFSPDPSESDMVPGYPTTAWLEHFRRRAAAKTQW